MSVSALARLVVRTGRIAEAAPPKPDAGAEPWRSRARLLGGSAHVRYVDAGGGQDVALELTAAFGPVYDAARYGLHLAASPRHADVLLVTGCVTRNMALPLRRTYEAMPEPRIVVAAGDAAIDGGPFGSGYGVVGPVSAVLPVDITVPGDPPEPAQLIAVLRLITGR